MQQVFKSPLPPTRPTRQVKINDFANADLPLADASFKRQDDETNVAMETFFFLSFFAWQPQQPGSLPNCCYGTAVSPSMPGICPMGLLDRLPV